MGQATEGEAATKSVRWSAVAVFAIVLALLLGAASALKQMLASDPWSVVVASTLALVAAVIAFGLIYGPKAFVDCLDAATRFMHAVRQKGTTVPKG
jgi:hypothetical protein